VTLSIERAAGEAPERTFLLAGNTSWTFEETAAAVRAIEAPVTRLVAEPTAEAIFTLLALWQRGRPAVLIHPRLTARERAALATPEVAPGTAVVVYTSGSTGQPRPIALPFATLEAAAAASAANLGWRDDDAWLLSLPFAHVGGLSVITRCLLARRTVVLGERGDVTLMSLVPTTLARAIAAGPPPARLRAVLVGGAACPPALQQRALAAGWPVLLSYGMTETAAQVATQRPCDLGRAGCGPPLPGVDLRISAHGHIEIRLADGWFDSGDLGRLDHDGHLHVLGRARDLIISGGENVSPLEVEAALLAHPGVAAACVVGVPDDTWGELVAAALVGSPGPLTLDLAPFKRPRRIAWLPALPLLPSGKPDRARVQAMLANAAATASGTGTF